MYGLVNKAVKGLVISAHGEDIWKQICNENDFYDYDFVAMKSYPDELTYKLVKSASDVLGASQEAILESFGVYWITYTADEGYGDLMSTSGDSFTEFLENLDFLHDRLGDVMPYLKPPMFKTRNKNDNSLELEYHSDRIGLEPMVLGLLKGLGKRFNLNVQAELFALKGEEHDCSIFKVSW